MKSSETGSKRKLKLHMHSRKLDDIPEAFK